MTFIVLLTFSIVIRNVFLYNAVVEQYSDLEVQLIYQQETFSERYILIVFWEEMIIMVHFSGKYIC